MSKKGRQSSNQGETGAETSQPKLMQGGLWTLSRTLLTTSALVLGVGLLAQLLLTRMVIDPRLDAAARNAAIAVAGSVAMTLDGQRSQLNAAIRHFELAERILDADADQIGALEHRASQLFAQPTRLKLYAGSAEVLAQNAGDSLGFALLDMLRKAEQDQETIAELHSSNETGREAVLVQALRDSSGGLVGFARIGFDDDFLRHALRELKLSNLRLTLQQATASGSWLLYETSPGELLETGVPIAGSIWQVGYSVDPEALNQPLWIGLAGVLVVALVALVALSIGVISGAQRRMHADQQTLRTMLNELLGKGTTHSRNSELGDFQPLFDWLLKAPFQATPENSSRKSSRSRSSRKPTSKGERSTKPTENFPDARLPTYEVTTEEPESSSAPKRQLPAGLVHGNGICGDYRKELDRETLFDLGRAIGSESRSLHQDTILVAHDAHPQCGELTEALVRGILSSGCHVTDLGPTAIPVLNFSTHFLGSNSGVMLSGSDVSANALCLTVIINGKTLAGGGLERLRERVNSGDLSNGEGTHTNQQLEPDYIERIRDDVQLARPMRLVIDAGHGIVGGLAPELFATLGCEVLEIDCEPSGASEPRSPTDPQRLSQLAARVTADGADLGLAFDGDGDRLGVVDSAGNIIWPDRLMILLARDVLSRQPGSDVVYDVKCSRHLASEILAAGGRPVMWKSGHPLIKEMMKQTEALLGGGFGGHIMFKERWYGFDDAMYAAARLIEVLAIESVSSAEVFAGIPDSVATPELFVTMSPGLNTKLMGMLGKRVKIPGAKLVTIDGIRAEFENGWGLVRAANSSPRLSMRFEADDDAALAEIQQVFREQLKQIAPDLKLPF